MKKSLLLFALLLVSISNYGQCGFGINSIVFSPIPNTNDLQLDINTSCCEIHHFNNFTLTSNGSDHIINLCYTDTGLLMPSTITSSITLTGLNSGGDQNFTINPNIYFGLMSQDCSSGMPFGASTTVTLTTPLTQARMFQLSAPEYDLRETTLFPNPNSGNFSLQLPSEGQQAQLTVTDLAGKEVYNVSNYFSGDSIQLKDLSKGLYLVKVVSNQTTEILKFIVQ